MSTDKKVYIFSLSNRSESIYEMSNIVNKREQFFIINDLNTIIKNINDRYLLKEDTVIVIKIIDISDNEQLTIEYVFNSLNAGVYIKKSNPNKNIIYNTDYNNFHCDKIMNNLFPLTEEKLLNYNLIKSFFK